MLSAMAVAGAAKGTGRFRRADGGAPVWVITASRHGSAEAVGAEIARGISDAGMAARAVRADDVDDLPAEGIPVVLGSAVYMGRWLKPARTIAARLRDERNPRPLWLFSVGPLGEPPEPPEPIGAEALADLGGERAREHRVFSGRLDRSRLSRRERLIVNAVKAPDGDYRDWDAIDAWASGIGEELRGAGEAARPAAELAVAG
jgi:menaquinone-dependent protoporphyrinogen oxidase